jgi:glycosyltransferase involved in cell wall biosynthesis
MQKRPQIIVDVSNLSIHAKKFIRTGIQEVVYKTLLSLVQLRSEFPDIDLILLPQLPRRFGNLMSGSTTVPYQNPATFILEGIENDFKLPSREVWGFDLKERGYRLSDEEALQCIAGADALHIQSMVNVSPLAQTLMQMKAKVTKRLSMTVYDLVPVFFPEYCDHGLARWFQGTYVPSIAQHVQHAVCISRNTAMDLRGYPTTRGIPKVSVLPLPFDLDLRQTRSTAIIQKTGLDPQGYLLFLGSLEPRKNFEALLDGFEIFKKICPQSKIKLVIVGGTGWKNHQIEQKMKNSAFHSDLIRTGYVTDAELSELIQNSLALAMVSQYEGYGLPIAQAFSKGTPILTTLGSSLPEACSGEALFVEPHDPWAICAGIQQLRRGVHPQFDPHRIKNWTWMNYAKRLLELISFPRE